MDKLALTKDEIKKLLCVLERSVIKDENVDEDKRLELWDILINYIEEMYEFLELEQYEGCIDPYTFEYKKFSDFK